MNELEEVLAEVRELRLRVAELEGQVATQVQPSEERSTRRGMLRLAGAAVVGGAAASLVGAQPAAALSGAMSYGAVNNAGLNTTVLNSIANAPTFQVTNLSPDIAIQGTTSGHGAGVVGRVDSPFVDGYGVFGLISGTIGQALVGSGGSAQLFLTPLGYDETAAPATGVHRAGEIVCNAGGFFACVTTGTADFATWRKLAGASTAGAFHAITPTRVYDSRAAAPLPGLLVAGANRLISVADGRDNNGTVTTPNLVPLGATAVAANVTVTGTTGGGGYLSVNPGGNTSSSSSTINWFGAGQNIANGVSLTLDSSRQLTVVCGAGGGSTHFIVDIAGYYL